jgi:hypothetical protein
MELKIIRDQFNPGQSGVAGNECVSFIRYPGVVFPLLLVSDYGVPWHRQFLPVYDTVHLGKKLFLFGLLLEFLEAVVSK